MPTGSAKTATIPSLRVEPELRAAAESVLKEGETLSSFVESSLRRQVEYRKTQAEFIARGLASLAEAERTGVYYTTDDVLSMMRRKLEAAKAAKRK
ncbi:prevent-host-death protein (plasmid) [Rhizobium sp. TRM96647]|uniref:YlcI/YnfO family protein n=1 Tax=unclassified Rhizobium TaxID=2613769 RepID=UPI0021E8858E|nr:MULTISPECIES: YlcI/YnfO family protein [unclassified Rhizobium]MCV3735573.1 prevent-host-death protein [Rhizobium sp. TRM96647]MCV3757664.1 prevent-host-death protein [Rhizobium sp. TRM96650]